jgi:hypothetical protein
VERETTDDRGWGAILRIAPPAGGAPAALLKVPHHGGLSAHDPRMWADLLDEDRDAILTPWTRGDKRLPTDEDCARILGLAPGAVIAGAGSSKPPRYEAAVERSLNGAVMSRRAAVGRMGHVQARCGPSDDGRWRLRWGGDARPLSPVA